MNELVAQNESLTPNGIYVGVTTLASIVFTRYRMCRAVPIIC